MTLALYGILVVFALFIVLMVFNPNLSCFGRRLKSPLYPILRRKKQKRQQTSDYGFKLVEPGGKESPVDRRGKKPGGTPEDYGFNLDREIKNRTGQRRAEEEKSVADEYGFDLRESAKSRKNQDMKDPEKAKE